jgi:hypothetical protein
MTRQPISIQQRQKKWEPVFRPRCGQSGPHDQIGEPISIQATPEKVGTGFSSIRPHDDRLPSSRSAFKQRQKKWEPVFRPALRPIKTP